MHLRVATFNAWTGAPLPWLWPRSLSAAHRTQALCDAVDDLGADAVLLQEVCSPVLQQALLHRFNQHYHVIHSPQRALWPLVLLVLLPLWALWPHLAVAWLLLCWLLRHEVAVEWWRCVGLTVMLRRTLFNGVYVRHVAPPAQNFWARLCRRPRTRQVVRCWLTLRRESIDLHNVHFDPGLAQQQFEHITRAPMGDDTVRLHSDVVVVGGDFNKRIDTLAAPTPPLTWCPAHNPLIAPQWWLSDRDRRGPPQALDHVIARSTNPAVTAVDVTACQRLLDTHTMLSDHYAVMAHISIVNAPSPPPPPAPQAAAAEPALARQRQRRTPRLLA